MVQGLQVPKGPSEHHHKVQLVIQAHKVVKEPKEPKADKEPKDLRV